MSNRDPATQFQIGDDVLYLPEGVLTYIDGYVWELRGGSPRIILYRLGCGVEVWESCIEKVPEP